jgi:hypothetical protein
VIIFFRGGDFLRRHTEIALSRTTAVRGWRIAPAQRVGVARNLAIDYTVLF